MKKTIIIALAVVLMVGSAWGAKLYRIRFGYYPDKIRAVMDFNGPFTYQADEGKEKIVIHLPKTEATGDIQTYVELSDIIVRYFEVEKDGDGLKISVPLGEPLPYKLFALNDPPRLCLDFERKFMSVVSGGTIRDGVEHLKVTTGRGGNRTSVNVLKINPKKAELSPALARKDKPNVLQSFINLFNPWREKDDDYHFYRARVSRIAEDQDAIAAINGTYFAYTGKPLGTLLIDKELVSSPIHDRTALIINDDGQAFIDNIGINCYFITPNKIRYPITGVNQGRKKDSVILYTPAWGAATGTTTDGIELVVVGSTIKASTLGNTPIPKDGYVLSISGPAAQFIPDNIKTGNKIEAHIKITPVATTPKSILHLVSGGPRLVKNGIPYVSKHAEKFKADIATSRAARTAVGITNDGQILLVTADGLLRNKKNHKQRGEKKSSGLTLEELSELLLGLGAVEAMNLDGGSSTTMWINGRLVNQPVGGSEQKVSNALIVRPKLYY